MQRDEYKIQQQGNELSKHDIQDDTQMQTPRKINAYEERNSQDHQSTHTHREIMLLKYPATFYVDNTQRDEHDTGSIEQDVYHGSHIITRSTQSVSHLQNIMNRKQHHGRTYQPS